MTEPQQGRRRSQHAAGQDIGKDRAMCKPWHWLLGGIALELLKKASPPLAQGRSPQVGRGRGK